MLFPQKHASLASQAFVAASHATPVAHRILEGATSGGGAGAAGAAASEVLHGAGSLLQRSGIQRRIAAGQATSKALRSGALLPSKSVEGAGMTLINSGRALKGVAPFAKVGSFGMSTSAFFDEMSKIQDAAREARDKEVERATGRPFSSMLTQDEEPIEYFRSLVQYNDEPEIILGRRIA